MLSVWISLLLIFVTVYRYAMYKRGRKRLEELMGKLPGPPTLPLIGHAHWFYGSTEAVLSRMLNILPQYSSRPARIWIGPIPVVVIFDPENFQIVGTKTSIKPNLYRFLKVAIGEGLITSNGETWKKKRHFLNPAMNTTLLNDFFLGLFNENNLKLVKVLKELADEGKEIDLWAHVFKCTSETFCVTAMGYDIDKSCEENESRLNMVKCGSLVEEVLDVLVKRMMKPWLQPDLIFKLYGYMTGFNETLRQLRDFPLHIIRKRKEAMKAGDFDVNDRRRNLIEIMLQTEMFKDLPDEELVDEVLTFVGTGSDTTSLTVCYTLLMFAMHQDIQDRVYDELKSVFGDDIYDDEDKPVERADLEKLTYLDRCIKETLRRFPVAPMGMRQIDEDITLADGSILPAGSMAAMAIIGLHLNERNFKDPFKYDPDRFTAEEIKKRHPYSFMPFSVGARTCIGGKYSMLAVKAQLAPILKKLHFSTSIKRTTDIRLRFDLALRNVTGYKVTISRRTA